MSAASSPWFKCYPRDFNDGMVGLTLEERGAYVTILNVIYARGGPIDDDPSYMRALLCCSAKTWVKIRASLIVKRKLFAVNLNGLDCLMNTRAAQEIADRDEKSQKFSDAGARGGRKTQAKINEIKDMGQATLEPASTILDTDTDTDTDTETETERVSEPKGSSRPHDARGSRLPDGWEPHGEDWLVALDLLGGDKGAADELDRFRDYWRAIPGAKGRKLDWPATWRNWARRASENKPRQALKAHDGHARPQPSDAKRAAREANYARAFAAPVVAADGSWD